ncbi:hypothetical protein J2X69_000145 [Algoriphagus sp. 4150]|uniref:RagB/SusD family nutrient uptake outer membrane protein n=1 Tax=Algoriphagus sp. 4150 TaxID=2817756 RepID=UPI00285DEF92|nr:RagB/SusD family nutrient uptake outer membrane protein [Algoriphagus sp. 4150]MDR7127817.1 hypothetical protein [Algoriphagus sp. 4150]
MKAIKIFLLSAILLNSIGCTELADESYSILIAKDFEVTESEVGSIIASAYVPWNDLFGGWGSYFWAQDVSSDALVIPKRPWGWVDAGDYRRLHEHKWTADDLVIVQCWRRAYRGITTTNRVIYQIENDLVPLGEFKENALAELKVLRATYYYVLLDMYGNIPIVTNFDVPEGFLPEQSSRKEVFDFLVNDITENIDLLNEETGSASYGRINKWVAHTLLAKLYLNAEVYTGEAMWDKCIEQCDIVIESNKYALESNQKNNFIVYNEGSGEIIWSLVFDENYTAGWNVFDHHMQTLPQEAQATYSLRFSPWGGICAIPQFIDTFNPLDERYTENWLKGQLYDRNGNKLTVQNGSLKDKDLVLINDLPAVDTSQAVHGLRLSKFEVEQGAGVIPNNDYTFFRYADILMMKAESLLRTGSTGEAAAIVTQIRERSFRNNPAEAPVTGAELMGGSRYDYGRRDVHVTTQEGGNDVLYGRFMDELGYEFFEECRRRQDMIRFGVFTTKSWFSHEPNGDYRSLYPIPQEEINKNSNLKQNPGY